MNSKNNFCGIPSPKNILSEDRVQVLKKDLQIPEIDYEVKMYYPKKFEALRRFYCGSQQYFIQSMISTIEWNNVSGGKTKSKFYRSVDEKYVFKEVKKSEFKMFLEFAPTYFDYLCKSFFHNYPCTLCKILGVYQIKTTFKKQSTIKYIYVIENLNFGIKQEDEVCILRYDLKGSTRNRFVKNLLKENNAQTFDKVVLHDNNFLWQHKGRPLPLRYHMERILNICINNDTLILAKSNIVDYSLLTIIDTKRKKVRFGIIDYIQQYRLDKQLEYNFKHIVSGGETPTIVDQEKYKQRFKKAMKKYFIGVGIQEEKCLTNQENNQDQKKKDDLIASIKHREYESENEIDDFSTIVKGRLEDKLEKLDERLEDKLEKLEKLEERLENTQNQSVQHQLLNNVIDQEEFKQARSEKQSLKITQDHY